jgi:hypothetical protein
MTENKSKKDTPQPPSVEEIDISNVGNYDAVSKKDPEVKKVAEKKKSVNKGKRASKFNFAEEEVVPLPSGGRLYSRVTEDEDILNGRIKLLPMTAREEEILSTTRFIKDGTATRRVLERCIASDIDAQDVLLFDSNFLLFYLRQISYGDSYEFELKCQNSMCEKKFDHEVKISELNFEELPEDVKEPIKVKLPKSKYTVHLILPRLYHSEEINYRYSNRKKSTNDEDKRSIDNFMVTTVKVLDDKSDEIDKKDWEEFFEALPGMDTAELREATDFSTGVDTLKDIECPYCSTDYSGTIPIGIEFFRF